MKSWTYDYQDYTLISFFFYFTAFVGLVVFFFVKPQLPAWAVIFGMPTILSLVARQKVYKITNRILNRLYLLPFKVCRDLSIVLVILTSFLAYHHFKWYFFVYLIGTCISMILVLFDIYFGRARSAIPSC